MAHEPPLPLHQPAHHGAGQVEGHQGRIMFVGIVNQGASQALLQLPAGVQRVQVVAMNGVGGQFHGPAGGFAPKAGQIKELPPAGAIGRDHIFNADDLHPTIRFRLRQFRLAIPADDGDPVPGLQQSAGGPLDPGIGPVGVG